MTDNDDLLPLDQLNQFEGILKNSTNPWSVNVYGGTPHGFAVRANITDPKQKFGKEEAFFQAVRFFQSWAWKASLAWMCEDYCKFEK